jgi:hypothetical protein
MGNRAVITTDLNGIGIYLHWNGGRDSVEAFLKYCELKGYRSPSCDSYGYARLTQVISNFFGGSLSIGIDLCSRLDCDNGDNGTYIIKGWEIVDRKYFKGAEQNEYSMTEMLQAIDEAQPEKEQLKDYLTAEDVKTEDLKIGDKVVFINELTGAVEKSTIIGFSTKEYANGHKVLGLPYMNRYGNDNPETNPNNYFFTDTVKVLKEEPNNEEVEMYINKEFNGIEVKFLHRPSDEIRTALKEKGFKWHYKKMVWYAKNDPDKVQYITELINKLS